MKVAHVIPDFGLGGIQKAACVLATQMAKEGHETLLLGRGSGPRFRSNLPARLLQAVVPDDESLTTSLRSFGPDAVHVHHHDYNEPLLELVHRTIPKALIVITPVFGRPPLKRAVMRYAHTVCVGLYTFYRLCRWLGVSGEAALHQTMAYVPLTPWEPPPVDVSATDPPSLVKQRRVSLGLNGDHQVFGRIGRDDPRKWHPDNERVISRVLEARHDVSWLSVGFPEARGRDRLRILWGDRFINLPETANGVHLATALSSMDVQLFLSCCGECFASSICEAAGVAVPTVALAMPLQDNGQYEQVIPGTTGTLTGTSTDAPGAVLSLLADGNLAGLKTAAQNHARERWHVNRVTKDLLALYGWWRDGLHPPGYLETMRSEYRCFRSRYRKDTVRLMGSGPASRILWAVALASAESWSLFKVGRFCRHLVRH